MYKGKKIFIVIPVYNEEKFVAKVIRDIPSFIDAIVVIDDASQDSTYQCVKNVGDSRVILLRNEVNQGVGGSTIKGYQKALEMESDIIIKVDGDGQMPLDRLPNLLDAIVEDGYDYAKGNRFLDEKALKQMPRNRLIGNMLLTFLTKMASGYWHIFDPQNGYTAIDTHVLKTIDLDRVHKYYFFENDMLVQLNIHNRRVKDVPMPAIYGQEKSGIRLISILIAFPRLLLQRFLYRVYQKYMLRDFSPIALFLLVGSLLLGWGVGFGIYHWIKSILTHVQASTGTVMLAVLPLILGFQLVLEAIVLDIHETPR